MNFISLGLIAGGAALVFMLLLFFVDWLKDKIKKK